MSTAQLRTIQPDSPAGPLNRPGLDFAAAEAAVADLLTALGQDLDDVHLRDTPARVAAAYAEMLTPHPFNPTTFPNEEGCNELVLARDIPFHSVCQHHLLPFKGVAHQRSDGPRTKVRAAGFEQRYRYGRTDEALVSRDIIGDPHSSIIDFTPTIIR